MIILFKFGNIFPVMLWLSAKVDNTLTRKKTSGGRRVIIVNKLNG
jgi:hypothetical protein